MVLTSSVIFFSEKKVNNVKIGTGGVLFEDMPRVFKLAKTTTYELLKSQNKHVSNTKANNQQMVESL